MLLLLENMKPIKTNSDNYNFFKRLNITKKQFNQAKFWYLSAKKPQLKTDQNNFKNY